MRDQPGTQRPRPTPAPSTAGTSAGGRPTVQRFEAQHHEHIERGALTQAGPGGGGGFSDAETSAVYFGNWSRDMSQALLNHPIISTLGQETVFEILSLIALQKFGRELNPVDFGVYSPREHIDNPAGQTTSDLSQPGTGGRHELAESEDLSSPQAISELFTVSEAGLPAYLGRSIQYVEEELSTAADLGRTSQVAPRPGSGSTAGGLEHLGNALHTVEDLFAHSNFVEIGVGKLIRDGRITFEGEIEGELEERRAAGLDPVETLAGRTDTGRPILTTGSYVASDTLVSLSEALTAFLEEFDPFAPSNKERGQALMEKILARYEDTDRAGELVRSAMQSMAANIPAKLREWVTSKIEPAEPDEAEEQGIFDRLVAGARRTGAEVVGGALDVVGDIAGWEWLQDGFAAMANQLTALPLTEIYRFTIDVRNGISDALKSIDERLQGVPFYPEFKSWVDEQLDALREALKEVITAAVKAAADLIKSMFGESIAEGSNIHQQIESAVQGQIKNAEARGQYESASHEEKVGMLSDPAWCERARITASDAEHLRAMIELPEWAQEGPSHSQIGKDHADSPFFGTAAVLASHAITEIRDLMVDVWTAEGRNEHRADEHEALEQNYADELPEELRRRLADPGLTPYERREAEREAAETAPHWPELQSRAVGEELLEKGALEEAEEEHPGEDAYDAVVEGLRRLSRVVSDLPETLSSLAARVENAAPDAAADIRRVADAIPAGLEGLAERAEHATNADAMRAICDQLRALARDKRGLVSQVQRALDAAGAAVESTAPAGSAVADELRQVAARSRRVVPQIAAGLTAAADSMEMWAERQTITDEQLRRTHAVRAETGSWAPELAASHGRGETPERLRLFEFVRELFGHPHDTTWWEEPLLSWADANHERLEAYIHARNSGRIHHHH